MMLNNLSKKLSYYNVRYKLKKFFLCLGENDFYPQLPRPKYSIISDNQRYNFWNRLAKRHKPFRYFYEEDPVKYFEENPPIQNESKYFLSLKKFYKEGVCELENFFNESEHKIILNFFEQNTLKNIEKVGRQNTICRDNAINSMIYDKTKNLENILFGKSLKQQNYNTQSIYKKKDENSTFGTSAHFHSDRFIPSIKLIYFPTEVKIDPFEYALGSHIIDDKFKENIFIEFENEKEIGKQIRKELKDYRENKKTISNKILDKADKIQYNFDFGRYKLKKFYCKANTLLIVATHGLHRRSQTFEKNSYGVRNNLTISYYNEFTRYDLLKKLYN